MLEKTDANPGVDQSEAASEVIGLLTAISIVSRRMAHRLALLNQQTAIGGSDVPHGRGEAVIAAANQSHAV